MTDDGAERLGEFIRRQWELHELSMRQVADMAGISNPHLSARHRRALLDVYRSFAGRR